MGSYLPEVPEAEAGGRVAELYEDVRRVLGLPLVNLVYRHLAVEPGRLEAAWRELRPNLVDAAVDAGAEELREAARIDVAALPREALRAIGLSASELEAVRATLGAYNQANPRNLIALLALLHGAAGTEAARPAPPRRTPPALLPIADLGSLDEPVRELLHRMAAPFAAPGEAILVPGLFRHFAFSPALLALFWTVLRPAARGGAIARRGNVVALRARRLAAALPHPVERAEDEAVRTVLVRFTQTVPRMLVAGLALERALDAGAAGPPAR